MAVAISAAGIGRAYHLASAGLPDQKESAPAKAGDADTLLAAFPQATYSSVAAILETPASFDVLSKAVSSDPTLKAKVLTSSAANEAVIKSLRDVLDFVSYFIGGLMGLGAVCGYGHRSHPHQHLLLVLGRAVRLDACRNARSGASRRRRVGARAKEDLLAR